MIIFQPGPGLSGLLRVSAGGGEPEPLQTVDPEMDSSNHTWPSFLPDGKALLTTVTGGQIAALSLEERRVAPAR